MKIKVISGSVVYADADAVVNASNNGLRMGDGVCGAIFEEAGIEKLTEACKKIGYCKTGEAVITEGFNLNAKYIVHTVGPIYSGSSSDSRLLASCYTNCLRVADEHNCKSIAFCCISTGIYGYPLEDAAGIAFEAVLGYVPMHLEEVCFYCYNDREFEVYSKLFHRFVK